jgi:para-nitrobenzyl esterase
MRSNFEPFVFILPITLFLFAIFPFVSGCSSHEAQGPVVFANGEELHGVWEGEESQIAAFGGVPFAAPPVGDLRWRAPLPNTPRPGPQSASEFAPGCMQTSYSTDWYARVAAAFGHGPEVAARPLGVSEDCLYLNIWTPQLDSEARLPVMVWVHGGSNKGGWSYEPNYIGTRLAAKGVVVVSIAYRLGAFGFFSHPALDNGEGQPVANFGWLDGIHAFKWVNEHIGAFGGDPKNITAIGESSGAGDISDWVAAEMAEDRLYHRAIAQSSASSLDERRTLADEQKTGERLIDSMGIEDEPDSRRLREVPAGDLLKAAESELKGHYFDAVIDDLTMSLRPIESLGRAEAARIDLLIGTNADEWYMYLKEDAKEKDLELWVEQNAPRNAQALLAEVTGETDVRRALDRLRTAERMLCPSRYFAGKVNELGGRGWVYYFTRQRPGPGGEKLGAYHGTEIPYVFDMHDDWLPTEAADRQLTDAVMDYWVQFARSGDPNIPGRPEWPAYSTDHPMVMELGDTMAAFEPSDTRLCELLGPGRQKSNGEQP